MKLLIDSSTNYLYLCIVNKGDAKYFVRSGKNDHSETLVDFLNNFLKENNITTDDITEVYVGRGPGSYTGLRIAGTVGKVLAHIKNKKLYSFSSLDLILASVIEKDGLYISRIDAKKKHSYYKAVNILDNHINVVIDESFGEDAVAFKDYENYQILEMNDDFFESNPAKNIIKYNLFKEESTPPATPILNI